MEFISPSIVGPKTFATFCSKDSCWVSRTHRSIPQLMRISLALTQALQGAAPPMCIPKFAVAFCTPQITVRSTNVKNKAYAIETEKSKAIEIQRILKAACKKTNYFVPFHLRAKHPEAFSSYIHQHTKILSQNHTIVLNYIGNQSILYLENRIRKIPGLIDIVPCQSVDTDGFSLKTVSTVSKFFFPNLTLSFCLTTHRDMLRS